MKYFYLHINNIIVMTSDLCPANDYIIMYHETSLSQYSH